MFMRLLMWVVMIIGGTLGGYYLDGRWFSDIHRSLIFHAVSFVAGLVLLKLVLTVSRYTGRTLARLGREGDVPRMETNKLVTTGRYGLMRHPMHLGLLFLPLSIALIVGSPSFILVIAPMEMFIMILLIKVYEETEAIEKFGDDYREYQKKTPMFCLSIRCIRALFEEVSSNR